MPQSMQRTVPIEKYQSLKGKYHKLQNLYTELAVQHAKCTARIKEADDKYATAKAAAIDWTKYLERHGWINKKDIEKRISVAPKQESPSKRASERIPSSQTTEGEPADAQHLATTHISDDEPEVVSARPVKRRRRNVPSEMPPPVRIKLEAASPSDPIMLGSEGNDDPGLPPKHLIRKDTSDLDAIFKSVQTKRECADDRARSAEVSRPRTLFPTTSSLSGSDLPVLNDENALTNAEMDTVEGSCNSANRNSFFASFPQPSMSNALQQQSVNIRGVPRGMGKSNEQVKRKGGMTNRFAAYFSEDGEHQKNETATPLTAIRTSPTAGRRLQHLLDEGSPSKTGKPLLQRRALESSLPEQAKTTAYTAVLQSVAATPTPGLDKIKLEKERDSTRTPIATDQGPLRSRPLASLNLDDFRINPAHRGSDFAFMETVRGREQRRCLPGCTRPECCGDVFKKAVELGGLKGSKTDSQVLEEYLGPDYAILMGAYGPARREELLVQARASAFANQHGKHRHAFERRSTPPGFWRTDMPTTQELEQDRASALSLERTKVEERWREAMRGGKWMFRDE